MPQRWKARSPEQLQQFMIHAVTSFSLSQD
jgi:hypothetical protein